MPTVLKLLGFRFFFYSNEGTEPAHVHVEKGDSYGKVWLNPIMVSDLSQFKAKVRRKILEIIAEHQDNFNQRWNEHFGQE